MRRRILIICLFLLVAFLIFVFPKIMWSMIPMNKTIMPYVNTGDSAESMIDRLGPATAWMSEIAVWHREKWTLVCGFSRNRQLLDYHIIDCHGRCVESTIGKENTVWHILNEIRENSVSEIERVYGVASGDMQYGKIGYDGGIVIWDNSSWREIYDYTDIHDEQPYLFKFVWSFFVERFFRFW